MVTVLALLNNSISLSMGINHFSLVALQLRKGILMFMILNQLSGNRGSIPSHVTDIPRNFG